jgi:RNA polymerase sigma factor (TIGR02999 family)
MEDQPITLLLQDFAHGNNAALEQLAPMFYAELRKMASGFLRNERSGHTLQPTALVHEFYARMLGHQKPEFQNRAHFLRIAARAMRRILIDHARGKRSVKRGGAELRCSLDDALNIPVMREPAIIAVDDALKELERRDPAKAQLVEMRFFGGLTAEESAETLNMDVNKVRYELRVAQAWLQRELKRNTQADGEDGTLG